jgi:protoporphyrinogen oxidase
MAKKRIVILGAGIAGLSAAWHLQRKGLDCVIFEKESEVGGLCRSKKIKGYTFDYCGHSLHFRTRYAFDLIKYLLDDNLSEHTRSAWVYSFNRFTRYPFQANLYGLPHSIAQDCLLDFIKASKNSRSKDIKLKSFSDWIEHTFGESIAKYFMIPYNHKFWTLSPRELTCEWLDGFVPVPSLKEVVEGTVKDSKRQFGYNARFWYPKRAAISQVPLAFAREVRNIFTDCQISEINLEKKEIRMSSGNRERFDYLVSTIPLPEISPIIKESPQEIKLFFKKLKWNSVFNLNLGIDKKDTAKRHWVYFPGNDLCFFRVGFYHNFSSSIAPPDKGSLYVEVSYSKDKLLDKNSIISRIKGDLEKVGLIGAYDGIHAQHINDIKYAYPIYDQNYRQAKGAIIDYLFCNNILPCGRYGSWRYMSMEDSILDGKRTAEFF